MHDFVTKLQEPTKSLMLFYGAGDHGGGPAKDTIRLILDAQKRPGAPQIIFSTPEKYFDDISKVSSPESPLPYPVVDDDLQHHSVGCYTAMSEIKKDNRTTEAALVTGEKMAALAHVLVGFPYPKADFVASWRKVLLMQFHDSMAGTALPEQYVVSHNAYGFAQEVANQAMYRATAKIAWQIPTTDPASEYFVVFNPHAWAAKLNVQYYSGMGADDQGGAPSKSRLEDEQGNVIPHQWVAGQTVVGDRKGLVFQAPVPAFGYRQFRLRKVEPVAVPESTVQVGRRWCDLHV
jgi:alpha-mannosidase